MKKEPVLVVMAAGMGSRYGGLKQIDPVGRYGELLIDYSLYDAKRAGFSRIVFIINHRMEADFDEVIGARISREFQTAKVFQEVDSLLPPGTGVPEGRKKPWGTGHAILCCKDVVDAPFAVINADDYYGARVFPMMYKELCALEDDDAYRWCMAGYSLKNTLTEYGHVARGVCHVDNNSRLMGIVERVRIEKRPEGPAYTEDGGATYVPLSEDATVSMNLWGFTVPSIFEELEAHWPEFLRRALAQNPTGAEYFLPNVVGLALNELRARVRVHTSPDRWYGVTYREDKPKVEVAIAKLIDEGVYPERLWPE